VALAEGEAGIDKFTDEKVNSPELVALRKKVKTVIVPDTDLYLGARATIRMKDGREFKAYTKVPKGDPDNPLSYGELAEKFRGVTKNVIPGKNIDELISKIVKLEEVSNIGELLSLCP
jgi:2-methylcitrate dehydratase PrpD